MFILKEATYPESSLTQTGGLFSTANIRPDRKDYSISLHLIKLNETNLFFLLLVLVYLPLFLSAIFPFSLSPHHYANVLWCS